MPAVTSGKVLVTGANGYIAMWCIQHLLEHGFSVRGTVRSKEKSERLAEIFGSYAGRVEFVIIDDITKEGVFDDAIRGVDVIQHLAASVQFDVADPDVLIRPAVEGVRNILRSVAKSGTSVKRIIIMSSVGAVFTEGVARQVFSGKDWNDAAVEDVRLNGVNADPGHKYMASKVLSERAAWQLFEDEKAGGNLGWDLVVFNPPFVIGPALHAASVPKAELGWSYLQVFTGICVGPQERVNLFLADIGWLDVRDLATAIVLATTRPEAANERFIISAGSHSWKSWTEVACGLSSDLPVSAKTYEAPQMVSTVEYNTSNTDKILAIKYRSMRDTLRDMLLDFKRRGLWEGRVAD